MSQTSVSSKKEKSSPYIRHIALVNIVKKTKRTFLSVVAVMISVAIIYTSLNLFVNVYRLTKSEATTSQGNYHYIVSSDVTEAASRQSDTIDTNLNLYTMDEDQIINIRSLNNQDHMPFTITKGSYPDADNEILVSTSSSYNVGDTITLDLSEEDYNQNNLFGFTDSISSDTKSYTYTVSGVYSPSKVYQQQTEGYECFYTDGQTENAKYTIYVYDDEVQYSDSVSLTASCFGVKENDIILNDDAIDYLTIRNYLQDTTTLLVMFVIIVFLSFFISIISLKNVFITSDKDRKKEFGLLKSVGATMPDLKYLINVELTVLGAIGAVLGVLLGSAVSYVVIHIFTGQMKMNLTTTMILNPYLLIFAFVVGWGMLFAVGYHSYKPYLHSNPIDDLKENTYNYDPPKKRPSYHAKSFSWKMFLIYNNRLKAQTRNIFLSFALLIMTTVLFMAILLSNLFYQIDIGDIDYDYYFKSMTNTTTIASDMGFINDLYDAEDSGDLVTDYMYISHTIEVADCYFETDKLPDDGILAYQRDSHVTYEEEDIDGKTMSKIYMPTSVLDDTQLADLAPYIDNYDELNLDEGGVILLLDENTDSSAVLLENYQVGDYIYFTSGRKEEIKAIIWYDMDDPMTSMYHQYGTFQREMFYDYDYYTSTFSAENVNDYISIKLENDATASKTTVLLEKLMSDNDCKLVYSNMVETRKECKIISFVLESLLYPLFFMLFIISILNINNVLIGNVHIKRGDISILKSVGMNSTQLYTFIAYEYAEGYMNAAFVAIAFFIPLCILENILNLTAAFSLGENMFATLLISILVIDLLLVIVLVVLSLKSLKDIDAIENMKNIT